MTDTAVPGSALLAAMCESCERALACYLAGFGTTGTPFLVCQQCLPADPPDAGVVTITFVSL